MQIGFVGLGRMGGNMVHRIHRDSDHQAVAFDFSEDDAEIPGDSFGFRQLIGAQAAGDLETLRSHGLDAVRVRLSAGDLAAGIDQLKERI